MKIRFFNNGKIGTARGDVANLFVLAGLAEEIVAEAPAPPAPGDAEWAIGFNGREFTLRAGCSVCGQNLVFFNPTEKAFLSHCRKVEKVPADVLQEYCEKKEGPTPAAAVQFKARNQGAVAFV